MMPLMDSSEDDMKLGDIIHQKKDAYEFEQNLDQPDFLEKINYINEQEYLKLFIQYVTDIFNKERGSGETKKANLGDIKST